MDLYAQYADECFRKIMYDNPVSHIDYSVTLELVKKLKEKFSELSDDDAYWFAEEAILNIHYISPSVN